MSSFLNRTSTKLFDIQQVGKTNATTRDKWLESTLATIPAGQRILDAGAGQLKYKRFCQHLNYVSQDFAQYDGKGDGKGLQTKSWDQTKLDIVSDIIAIPEPDESFDAIMCIEVLEHLPNPILALQELVRLLRPNGYLIVTTPFASLTHFAPYHFQTGFSRYFYEHWCRELGLEIIELKTNGNYFEYVAQEMNRLPTVAKKYTTSNLSIFEKVAHRIMIKALQRFSQQDSGSDELLCYGIQILARKPKE